MNLEPPVSKSPLLIGFAKRGVAFAVTFYAGLFLCPLLGMFVPFPRAVSNFLFFWPQFALVPYGFTHPASDMTHTYFSNGINYAITIPFWTLAGTALSCLLIKRPISVTILSTLPVSFAIAVAAFFLLGLYDVGIYLEGP